MIIPNGERNRDTQSMPRRNPSWLRPLIGITLLIGIQVLAVGWAGSSLSATEPSTPIPTTPTSNPEAIGTMSSLDNPHPNVVQLLIDRAAGTGTPTSASYSSYFDRVCDTGMSPDGIRYLGPGAKAELGCEYDYRTLLTQAQPAIIEEAFEIPADPSIKPQDLMWALPQKPGVYYSHAALPQVRSTVTGSGIIP